MPKGSLLPDHLPIPEVELVRHKGLLEGPISVGEVFAWEPDLPHARELIVVVEITDDTHRIESTVSHDRGLAIITVENGAGVRSRSLSGGPVCWNDMSRFREAAMRTKYQNMFSALEVIPRLKGGERTMTLDERIARMKSAQETVEVLAGDARLSARRVLADVIDEVLTILRERREDEVSASR